MSIEGAYDDITVVKYVIMPDHIHLLLVLNGAQGSALPTVSKVVKALKVMVRKETGYSFFQSSFYDHIIRCQQDYDATWEYIDNNPLKYKGR